MRCAFWPAHSHRSFPSDFVIVLIVPISVAERSPISGDAILHPNHECAARQHLLGHIHLYPQSLASSRGVDLLGTNPLGSVKSSMNTVQTAAQQGSHTRDRHSRANLF